MSSPSDAEFILRVLLATGCGAAIGLERQYRSRTAGLRTQALVAAGAAAFVLFGEQAGMAPAPLQIAAYVVSGVGFLGGGVILRQGFSVQGLNTAATLWCSAAVGCQCAGGHLLPAVALTVIVLAIHTVLRPLARSLDKAAGVKAESVATYTVVADVPREHEPRVRAVILQELAGAQVTVRGVDEHTLSDDGVGATVQLQVQIAVEGRPDALLDHLVSRASLLEPAVRSVGWHADDNDQYSDDASVSHLSRWSRLGRRRSARTAH